MTRTLLMLATAASLAACAAARQPPAFDPVGSYDFTTQAQGNTIPGALTVRRTDQGLAATITTQATGEFTFQTATLTGRRLELRGPTPQGDVVMTLDFAEDDRFTGTWSVGGGMSGNISGTRRAGGL